MSWNVLFMSTKPEVFIIFGRDRIRHEELCKIVSNCNITSHTLERDHKLGKLIPDELTRIMKYCDAAIVLATPDDFGGLIGTPPSPRARENLWIELGWFWAELGLTRTLLITHNSISPPSDLQGVFRLTFQNDLTEIESQIGSWLNGLVVESGSESVDLVRTVLDTASRNGEYQDIHKRATRELLISGIGMINVRQDLPILCSALSKSCGLRLTFIIPSDEILSTATDILPYRQTEKDIGIFISDLEQLIKDKMYTDRLSLFRYRKVMTFVATVADICEWGSHMLIEFPLPVNQYGLVERPRMLLRRRSVNGLYDRFATELKTMQNPDVSHLHTFHS